MKALLIYTEKNRYDILLVLVCWLMAAGNIGDFFQPVRVLIILLIPLFVLDSTQQRFTVASTLHTAPSYRYELRFFILWWIYAALSLYWAIEFENSVKSLLHLTINFFGFGEILWLASKARSPQKALLTGWGLMFLTTLPIAMREFLYDQHLSMSIQEQDMTMKISSRIVEERRFASVTFGNLNSYNVVLCMTFCLMLIRTFMQERIDRLFGYGTAIGLGIIIAMNSSRAALICILFSILLYVLILLKRRSHAVLLLSIIGIGIGIFVYRFADLFSMILLRFQTQGFEDIGRAGVIAHGIEELGNSYGLGIGIGNFIPTMLSKYHLDIAAPHNLLLEVGVQFGIIILALFIGMFIRIYKQSKTGNTFNHSAALLGIIPFIPLSIIDSGYIMKVTTWIYIATLYVLTCNQYNEIDEKS